MSETEIRDPFIDWLPERFSEKHRRYYVKHERVERRCLKRLERSLVRAFRYALAKYLRARGYVLDKSFLEDPERFGPTPGVLWMLFLDSEHAIAVVGDSSLPQPSSQHSRLFVDSFAERLRSRGYDVKHVQLLDLSDRYRWGDARRAIYVRLWGVTAACSEEE